MRSSSTFPGVVTLGSLLLSTVGATPVPDAAPGAFGTCQLDLSDLDAAWKASKAPTFLDSFMYPRGSGKLGSVAGLDKTVDVLATGLKPSLMDCTDLVNGNCGPYDITDCANSKKPVYFWLKYAFSNLNGYYNKLNQQIGWLTLQGSLSVEEIVDDVKNGWDNDPLTPSTLYNHVGAGMGIAGSVLGAVPEVGPFLGVVTSVIGGWASVAGANAANALAQQEANAAALQKNATVELNNRLSTVMGQTQDSLAWFTSWMFQTGADWPNNNPPKPQFDADEQYLPTQMFGKGAFLAPAPDMQNVQDTLTASLRRSLFGMGLKANDAWATWASSRDSDFYRRHKTCEEVGWYDEHGYCWAVVVYTSVGPATGQDFDQLPPLLKKYDIDIGDFFKTILDCASDPTPDGEVDPSGAPGVANYPKCFFSLGVTGDGATKPVAQDIPHAPWS